MKTLEVTIIGHIFWLKDGTSHRDLNFPAAIYSNGCRMWMKNGKFIRESNLPVIIYSDGTK